MKSRGDAAATLFLLIASLMLAAPILAGGARLYMDHPVHLAEVDSIARSLSGWCDDGFCGFPVLTIQSPLWYGLLGLLARLGLAPLVPYTFLVWLGFVAPALALYRVARRSLAAPGAGALAFLLLIQHPALVGFESALAGMWTWHLGLAGVILLLDALSRELRGRRDAARVAALTGLIGLTHLMALVAAALVLLMIGGSHAARRRGRALARHAVAALLGLVASSAFWLMHLMSVEGWSRLRQDVHPVTLFKLLLLPFNIASGHIEGGLFYADALPLVALLGLGVGGMILARRRPRPGDTLARNGAALAGAVLALLLLVRALPHPLLGPLSWRFVLVVRVGLALAAIPALAALQVRVRQRWWMALAAAGLVSCVVWGAPLRQQVPSASSLDVAQVESVWRWLGEHRDDYTGRVVVQDTFGNLSSPLSASHVMARTRAETGIPQVGAWYGGVPFPTFQWTQSEFDGVMGIPADLLRETRYKEELIARMDAAGASLLVIADPGLATVMGSATGLDRVRRAGNLTVFARTGPVAAWISPQSGGDSVRVDTFANGRIAFAVRAARAGGNLQVAAAWHPFWRVQGLPGATLTESPRGLLVIQNLPAGNYDCRLTWRSPLSPVLLSALGWLTIMGMLYQRPRRTAD
ncbi:MAG TPA: hypothetical protein VFX92_00065 [Candidatus Krumholzibacteria bacterium]|nr:hypothetical protein [Candidatus Krumholzibacteria bacterium]